MDCCDWDPCVEQLRKRGGKSKLTEQRRPKGFKSLDVRQVNHELHWLTVISLSITARSQVHVLGPGTPGLIVDGEAVRTRDNCEWV